MHVPLLAAFLSAVPSQAPSRTPQEGPEDAGTAGFVYYDYLEGGELRGGRVPLEPGNPLHVEVPPEVQRFSQTSAVTPLLVNGPSENRIDLVFVGDGYTAAQLGQYASDVDSVWPTFLAEPPLAEYVSYFNLYRVDVISPESGVDNDPTNGIQRNTALDMGYWCSGVQRLLCVNVFKANQEARNAPAKDVVLALANSTTYGGAGYSNLGTLAGRNGSAIEIALHEFGHSFAGLADEYDYGGPATYVGPEPSEADVTTYTEAEMVSLDVKWARWLDLAHVGFFEGAMYSRFGIFRPTQNSKMRNLGRPFQEPNSERFVRHMYRYVHPIDDATPEGTYPLDASFFVVPLQPLGHDLDVQWSLNGVPIPGATDPTFDAATLGLVRGLHELSVEVADRTPLVRNPNLLAKMKETRTWALLGDDKVRPAGAPPAPAGPRLPFAGGPAHGVYRLAGIESAARGLPAVVLLAPEPGVLGAARLRAAPLDASVVRYRGPLSLGPEGEVRLELPFVDGLPDRLFARVLWPARPGIPAATGLGALVAVP